MNLEPVRLLAGQVGDRRQDLFDEHGRWRVYQRAIAMPESHSLLRRCVVEEEDPAVASAVVVGVLGRIAREERSAWVGVLPVEFAEFARRRAAEWDVLEDVLSGVLPADRISDDLPGWSDWLQLRLAEEAADRQVLDQLADGGRTKRIMRVARGPRSQ